MGSRLVVGVALMVTVGACALTSCVDTKDSGRSAAAGGNSLPAAGSSHGGESTSDGLGGNGGPISPAGGDAGASEGGAKGIVPAGGDAGDTSASGGAAGAGGTAQHTYPAGPYGTAVGDVLVDICFQGLRDPKAANYQGAAETICLHDYYNPMRAADAPRVLVLTVSAMWCSPCNEEEKTATANRDYWSPLGAEFMTALSEDQTTAPPTLKNAQTWSAVYKLDFAVVLDGEKKLFQYFDMDAYPKHLLVDLTSMKLISATIGAFDVSPASMALKTATGG